MRGGGKAAVTALHPPAERRRGRSWAAAGERPPALAAAREEAAWAWWRVEWAGGLGEVLAGERRRTAGAFRFLSRPGGVGVPSASRYRGGEPAPAGEAASGSGEGERSPPRARTEALRLLGGNGRARGGALPVSEIAAQPGPGHLCLWVGFSFSVSRKRVMGGNVFRQYHGWEVSVLAVYWGSDLKTR